MTPRIARGALTTFGDTFMIDEAGCAVRGPARTPFRLTRLAAAFSLAVASAALHATPVA